MRLVLIFFTLLCLETSLIADVSPDDTNNSNPIHKEQNNTQISNLLHNYEPITDKDTHKYNIAAYDPIAFNNTQN